MSNNPKDQHPKVGVGVMIMKDGKVLLGLRKGAHGPKQYAGAGRTDQNFWDQ